MPDARTWIARNGLAQDACASSKDYLHCVLSLGKATILCTKCGPRPSLDPRHFETETHQDTHREQPERPSHRPSPRRLPCVRARRLAGPWRLGRGAGTRALRVRGSPRSGRQPRLTTRLSRTLNSRGPDPAKDPGLFVCPFTSGVPPHSDAAKPPGVRGAGCARQDTRPRAARRHLRREGSREGTAEVEVFKSCSSSGQDARFSTLQRGFESRTRRQQPEVAQALTPRDANRPQRLGGSGTRDRNLSICLVNSVARVLACLAGGRRFEPGTGRHFVRLGVAVAQWQSPGLWVRSHRFDSDRPPPSGFLSSNQENIMKPELEDDVSFYDPCDQQAP